MASSIYSIDRFLVGTSAPAYQASGGTWQPAADDHGTGTGVATEFPVSSGLPFVPDGGAVTGEVASDATYRKSDAACEIEGPGNGILG